MSDIIEIMARAMCIRPGNIDPDAASMGQDGFSRPAIANRMIELRAALRAALEAGWRLVPIEPTKEMRDSVSDDHELEQGYRAMLAAAPDPLKVGAADPKIDAAPVPNLSDEERRDDQ